MDFGNLTDDILDFPYLNTLEGPMTLREQLYGLFTDEDILWSDYKINQEGDIGGNMNFFVAWTDSYVITLIRNPLNEDQLISLPRNPEVNN